MIATNSSNTPSEEQREKPKQGGRFIIAMIPVRKKPLPPTPTKLRGNIYPRIGWRISEIKLRLVLAAKIMSLLAYLDDSGTHANKSPVCVAARYYGGVHYWKRFNLDWLCTVKNRGLSEFHASRFWPAMCSKPLGEYKGWSKDDCESFLTELLDIIRRYRIWPVGSAVVSSDWNALTVHERRYVTGAIYKGGEHKSGGAPNKPYFAAFLFAVQNIAAYCDDGHIVDFVVDESKALNNYSRDFFHRIKTSKFPHAGKLGTIQAADSRTQPGLQAADLLAYLTLKRTRQGPAINLEVDSDAPLGKAISKARSLQRDFKLLGRSAFDKLLKDFRKDTDVAAV